MIEGWLRGEPENLEGFTVAAVAGRAPVPVSFGPPRWRERAACIDMGALMLDGDADEAKLVCEGCPVRAECLAFALDTEPAIGVWAGTTFAERRVLCPICHGPKEPSSLGCDFSHTLWRIARLSEIESEGDPDVRLSKRQKPSYRTNPYCVLPRGWNHSTARAYSRGCRCDAARRAKNEEERRYLRPQKGKIEPVKKPRGRYKKDQAS